MAEGDFFDNRVEGGFYKIAAIQAAVTAYFATSMFPYANADHLMGMGAAISSGIIVTFLLGGKVSPLRKVLSFAALAAPLVLIGIVATETSGNYVTNQRRCLDIEIDMLSAKPKRSNDPEIYQALRCVPQAKAVADYLQARADRSRNLVVQGR